MVKPLPLQRDLFYICNEIFPTKGIVQKLQKLTDKKTSLKIQKRDPLNYLSKLIKLNSPNFEFYIKKLEELKKKLRNDGEGEEDEDNGMVNSELGLDKKLKGEESEKDKKKEEDKKKDKSKHKKDKEKDQSSTKKKKREKLTKMQMLKETKIKTMSKSFFIWNFFFILRGVGVFVIAISYFLVISIIQASYKNKFLEFDSKGKTV